MAGLQRILKSCGMLTVSTGGKSVTWYWDYKRNRPYTKEMIKQEKLEEKKRKEKLAKKHIKVKQMVLDI